METKLRALYDLGQKLILLRDARQIAADVLRIAARVIDLHDSDFFLVDEGRRELYTIARRGCLHNAGDVRLPLGGDKGITVVAAQTRKPIYVPDVRQDPRYVHTGFSAVSELAVPVQTEDRVLGVINVESEQLDAFSEVDQELLSILANQAALALNNARLHCEERRWAEQMIALNELSRRIGTSLDLQATLEAIATAAYELIPCALAEISLWDAGAERLTLRALRGEPRPVRPLGASYPPGPGYTGWLVRHKQPLLIPDVDARQDIRPPLLSGRLPYQAYVGVPLLLGQELIGILALIANKAGAFNDAHVELLTALAAQAAVAIRNARFYEEVTRRHRELTALYAVASAINQPLPLYEILDEAITKVIEVMEAEAGVIRLLDEEAGELAITSCQGFSPAYIRQVGRIPLGEGIVGRVAQSGEPLVVQDLASDPRSTAAQAIAAEGFHTLAVVPLKAKQEIVGTLGVVTHRPRDFGAADLDLLTAIGQQIGVAVENARLYANLSRRARELEAVHAVAAAVNRPGDLRQALEEGLKQALAVTGLEMGAIAVTDRQCETLALEYHQGVCTECDWLKELLKKKPLEACSEVKDLDIEEIPAGHPGVPVPLRKRKIRLSADVPLFAEGKLVGILSVASRRVRSFSPEERSLLRAIGHQLGTAIANAQLRQEALAAERMAAVGRVATSVAHDLRSPLGGILRSAEFLARPELSPGTRQRLSEATVSLARRLIITTQEILDYVRGGKLPLRRDLASLPEFLNGVLAVLEVDFSDQGIEVMRDCGYTGTVVMDTDRMAQVVYNIAANARDAMPRGGTFKVATRKAGERIELRFTDTGPGVPQELSDRIFEPFFTYGKREGAGLGLAIARRIVEEHDGELWMESSDGAGAAFVVSLPAC